MISQILFIETGVFEGGSFVSLVKHIDALDKTKFKPIIVFLNNNKWIEIFKEKGDDVYIVQDKVFSKNKNKIYTLLNAFFMKGFIKWQVIPFLRFLHKKSIQEIEDIIDKHQIDFVHLNTELFRDRIGLLAAANKNVSVISHLRSKYELGKINFSKEYVRFANNHVKTFIAVSNDTANFWINEVKLEGTKFKVLYDYFEPISNDDDSDVFSYNGVKIVCVANILPVKGHRFLIQACAPILKNSNVKLFLLGKGDDNYVATIKSEIKSLEIEKSVEFVGYRNDVASFLKQSDLVLLFSKREGLPNVIIESLGMGAVVLATNVGGIPEIIEDEVNGFLVPFGNIIEATNKIQRILQQNKTDLALIKENATKTVGNKFSKANYSNVITKIYE